MDARFHPKPANLHLTVAAPEEVDVPVADTPVVEVSIDEISLAEDQFAVTGVGF